MAGIPNFFGAAVTAAIKAHAAEQFPKECCGVVTEGGYIRFQNVADDPVQHFDCDAQLAPYLVAGTAKALVHSHGLAPERPSYHDQQQQLAMDIPWGICVSSTEGHVTDPYYFGRQIPVPPLEGRPFRWGPSGTDGAGDCGALFFDWYRLHKGILLKDRPRPDEFDSDTFRKSGRTYYRDALVALGFTDVGSGNPQDGDVPLMQIQSSIPNHTGVWLEGGFLLHHFANRLSGKVPMGVWSRCVQGWYRHDGKTFDRLESAP